ncbi:alternate-type signal peptide domain-containing protein [Plantibacter sp. VKM Ac-2880]|uniref:alternate-type signal peptide domain-containing protein n=1 Tax=Plantibacter sp. VKM Ac-2880 TaxID=2783827 RepID=UPI00188E4F20|nr:alternate-type signal peptide domain-containing protein [Plantibacter sp. VKM Ac-2880]MBF4570073.1 alternate-type signal peptide domain-containing protein [Plantibacter sp. VKM Ac-2880]
MMRSTTRGLTVSALLGALGVGLLFGGSGTLATWQESAVSPERGIETGTLDLGPLTSGSVDWRLSQRIPGRPSTFSVPFSNTALVPGDVLTGTTALPIELVGQTLTATLQVTPKLSIPANPKPADTALSKALSVTVVSIDGTAGAVPTFSGQDGKRTVPVVIEISYPWGADGQYGDATGGTVSIGIEYTLTQNRSK